MSDYRPDNWVVLRVQSGLYKVLAGWSGGYIGSDEWRLNSGIISAHREGDVWFFHGSSGSVYACHVSGYRLTQATVRVYNQIEQMGAELMPPETDWSSVDYAN